MVVKKMKPQKCKKCRKKATAHYLGEPYCQEHFHLEKGEKLSKFLKRVGETNLELRAKQLLNEEKEKRSKYLEKNKERLIIYKKEYNQRPEVKQRKNEYMKKYRLKQKKK